MIRTKSIKKGKWRTLESFLGGRSTAFFRNPAGATIRIRYGIGWLGKDSQKQVLDGNIHKALSVGKWSFIRARMQIKVKNDTELTYEMVPESSPFSGTVDQILTLIFR